MPGDSGIRLTEQVSTLTGGKLNLELNEPGAIVGANEMWDAISTGAVDACTARALHKALFPQRRFSPQYLSDQKQEPTLRGGTTAAVKTFGLK